MAQDKMQQYGTFRQSPVSDMEPDVELHLGTSARSGVRLAGPGGDSVSGHEKGRTMSAEEDDERRSYSGESHESAQAGVKRLEAIASTWSATGLYVAYFGYAISSAKVTPTETSTDGCIESHLWHMQHH